MFKNLFMKKKKKSEESLNMDELLKMMKGDDITPKNPEQIGPTSILDALEEEMKNAKIIEKPEEKEGNAITEVKKSEDKNAKVEEKKETLILEVDDEGKDAQYEVEPFYKTDDSNPKFFKAAVKIIII